LLWVLTKKLGGLVPVLLVVSFLTFGATTLLPGCIECQMAGVEGLEEDDLAEIRADLRLDDPITTRYGSWLGDALSGDLGRSFRTRQTVVDAVGERLPVTLELVVLSLTLSLVIAVPLGTISAYRAGGRLDRLIAGGSFGALAIPSFVLAVLLVYVFAVEMSWFPASGWTPLTEDPVDNLRTAFMPALAMAATNVAIFTRMLRTDMISTLQEQFVTTAQAKGLPPWRILVKHCLRPSSFSLLTVAGLAVGNLLGGAVIVEQLFALPGLGRLLLMSIAQRDLVMVQASYR
jgi:peptide/nickel transport system permease protein